MSLLQIMEEVTGMVVWADEIVFIKTKGTWMTQIN